MTVGHLALALLALGAVGCGARGSAEAPKSPGLQPWEVRYDSEATIDPASGEIHATTRLFLGSEGGSEGVIGLLLNRGLEVRSVDGPGVRSYRVGTSDFAPTWNLIEIDLDLAAGEAIAVDLAYDGVLDMGGSVGGITATSVELSGENMWHPLLATFDREIGALRVRLPDGWTVVSSGAARVVEEMHALDMRIPQLDVPLFAAPGLTLHEAFHSYQRTHFPEAWKGGAVPADVQADRCFEPYIPTAATTRARAPNTGGSVGQGSLRTFDHQPSGREPLDGAGDATGGAASGPRRTTAVRTAAGGAPRMRDPARPRSRHRGAVGRSTAT